jgi:RNA polymerase sigma factor (sigma-70 family)
MPEVVGSDEGLLACAGEGNEQALATLYDRYAGPAYGLALRILRDSALAEDALQDAFLQVWRSAARFDGRRGTAGSWIMTIVHRRAVDLVRRAEHERRCIAGASEAPDPHSASAEEEAWLRERRRSVRTALERLPVDQRALIELAYFEGLTQSELAERLDVPLGTVKSRTFAGLSRLRALFADGVEAETSRGPHARAV